MKKLLCGLLAVVLCFSSFRGNAQSLIETGDYDKDFLTVQENINAINEFDHEELSKYSEFFQKLCFTYISNENKARLWIDKFNNVILNEENLIIKEAFEEIKNGITPEFYSQNNPSNIDEWMKKYVDIIGYSRIKATLTSLTYGAKGAKGVQIKTGEINVGTGPEPSPNSGPTALHCGCSQTSDWCGSGSNCRPYKCTEHVSGCGFLWQSACNGRCLTPDK